MKEIRRIQSDTVKGIVKEHDDHSGSAPMTSTGALLHMFKEEGNPRNWFMEFKCSVCGQAVIIRHVDLHDLIRQALKEQGIIKD
jgi:hypothetical protein